MIVVLILILIYFNPRSHERSDDYKSCPSGLTGISIHAPTRGATKLATLFIDLTEISIHAPTRGATKSLSPQRTSNFYFNPRSHERSDRNRFISTADEYDFNPRSHERSDSTLIVFFPVPCYFNPRSHERSDCISGKTSIGEHGFQSTLPREERQLPQSSACYGSVISIHAPTRGATITFVHISNLLANFNPRSHERSDDGEGA